MRITYSVFIALAGALLPFTAGPPARAANYFVSPGGADTNPGTLEQPFATPQRAQQAARQAKGREPVTVFLREGTYYLPGTLTFTAEDSGAQAAPVAYQAYQEEQVVISGGARLKDLKWEPLRDGILKTQVPAGFATDQLFVNGERRPMARYPNFNPDERIYNGYAADAISPERAKRWADPRGGQECPPRYPLSREREVDKVALGGRRPRCALGERPRSSDRWREVPFRRRPASRQWRAHHPHPRKPLQDPGRERQSNI